MELNPKEEIKQIKDFPNYYITNQGRVWSAVSNRWLIPTVNTRGNHQRAYVSLGRGNKRYVHRLVAEAFLPNPDNLPEIDHKDTNGLNNNVENLRWITHQDNLANPISQDHVKKNKGYYVEIEEIATGKKFIGYDQVAEYAHLHPMTIKNHTHNKVKNPKWKLTGKRFREIEK